LYDFKIIVIFIFLFSINNIYSYDKSYINQKRWNKSSYVFDLNSIPKITIEISTNQWNSLLKNFDANRKNETDVTTDFIFDKNGKIDELKDIGIRIRGNTSRKRPEGKKGELHNPIAPDWKHAHFRLSLKEKSEKKSDFYTLKNLNLKWFKDDGMYAREIYCYDLFQKFGVYTAPRSSYCKLYIKIKEDKKEAYFGIYEMVEPVDKEYLKTRFNKTKTMNNGDLWKCLWGANLRTFQNIGIEDPDNSKKPVEYDLKTNKKDFENAKKRLTDFITNLNKLDDKKFYTWIKNSFDVDLFLKSYAVNVIVGMWDDYWANNGNNYYLYFDDKGKGYFIPFDYDNTLGTSLIVGNSGYQDIFNWGENNAILIKRILSIKEFKTKYAQYISELINPSNDYFDPEKSIERIKKWQNMIKPYIANDTGEDMELIDKPAKWANCHFYKILTGDENGSYHEANYFKTRVRFAKEQLKNPSEIGAEKKYSDWLMNSPFIERNNYTVDVVFGVKNPPKVVLPVKVNYIVLKDGAKTPDVSDILNPEKSQYTSNEISTKGVINFTGSYFDLLQIHDLEISKKYDIYFIIENIGYTQPKQLMKKLSVTPEIPKISSPDKADDKIIFRCFNTNPDQNLFVAGDFNNWLKSDDNSENWKMKDENKDKIFELSVYKSLLKKGDKYLFYTNKDNLVKNGIVDSCNKEKIKENDIYYSVIDF